MARSLEAAGISTIVLTPTPEFQREVGMPRVAAIEFPYGRPLGQVDDIRGQHQVLAETLTCLEKADRPGRIFHLNFTWPEAPKEAKWHPPEISPIIKLHLEEIKKAAAQTRK
ncbi:MAG: hypothetical protein C4519_17595 [Desulfobacteraceae bacterium]|nr:MAG: hypothetical protein C4519_17595 [Desulfobacteraceae bacterium]